jgi:hypothetical protein
VEAPVKKKKSKTAREISKQSGSAEKEATKSQSAAAEAELLPQERQSAENPSSVSAENVQASKASVGAGEDESELADGVIATTPLPDQPQQQQQQRRRTRREVFRGAVPRRGPVVTVTDQVNARM